MIHNRARNEERKTHGVNKMMRSKIIQTEFQIEKIRNVVNVGRSSAYQIFTYSGKTLGQFTTINDPAFQKPANEDHYTVESRNQPAGSWLKRKLAALRF